MRNSVATRIILACVAFVSVIGTAAIIRTRAQGPTDQKNQDKLVISRDEVLFDVVVRDKKGNLIRDLAATDFEVYEDGVKQEVSSFKFISATPGESAAPDKKENAPTDPSGTPKPSTPSQTTAVSAIALVFDRLSAESRPRATEAALSYLGDSVRKSELVGVFLTDLSVVVLQPFTSDTQLIKTGIEKAGVRASSLAASNTQEARASREVVTIAALRNQSSGSGQGARPAPDTESIAPAAAMSLRNLEAWEELQRDQQGNATMHGLLNIASALRTLPGRKAVIFFSEGLVIPPNVHEVFRSVVNAANRSNVSFYAVDVAGLRTESKTAEARKEINSRSEIRMAQLGNTSDPSGPMTKGLERNEDILRLNPESGLGLLANDTGGFLITDSNDLKNRIKQVDEDLHSYYLLSYSSNNQKYDGRFRKIEVKLKRSGLSVQSRKGYYAIKGTYSSPVLSYEAPAIAALSNASRPNAFPFLVGGFSFPDRQRIGLAPIIVDVPMSAFTFHADHGKKVYDTDFSIVTLIKDQTGQVVSKLSQQYRLNGPLDKVEEAKNGRVLFYREPNLPPDRYTVEVIAYDAPSGRASVRSATFEVSASDEGKLRLSDVLILKRAEPAGNSNQNNPFRVGNMIAHPNLGEPIQKSSLKQVPFYFTVYVPTSGTKPKLTIELRKGGAALAKVPGELKEADALGRIQFVAGLPLEQIPAGSYELKITVSDGTTTLARSGYFTIAD